MKKSQYLLGYILMLCCFVALQSATHAQSDVTQPGDPILASSDNSPGSEGVANAIDGQPTKYLNFDTTGVDGAPSGFVVSPSVGMTLVTGITLQSANDAVERDPLRIRLEGSNDAAPTWDAGAWQVIYENDEVPDWPTTFPDGDRFQTQTFPFENDKPFLHYRWTTLQVQGEGANSMQIAEVELLGNVLPGDVTQPGDALIASSDNSPGSEGVANAIDGQPTKYLNFDTTGTDPTPSGFVVTPSVGLTRLVGLTMQSANDAVERDPKFVRLEGSNDGSPGWDSGNWEVIYENPTFDAWAELFPDDNRFKTQGVTFANTKPFRHYRWTVLEVQGEGANSMQIAEVELLGEVLPGDVTQPGDPVIASSDNSPGSEGVANAIDNQPTKYLNFDTTGGDPTPSGFVVTPGVGRTVLFGLTMQSANDAVERDPKIVRLEGSNDTAPTWDTGNWEVIYLNEEVPAWTELFPDDNRFQTQTFIFDNQKPYAHYRWTVDVVQGEGANSMQIAEVELLGRSAPVDVLVPSDPIIASSDNSPGSEGVANAIDNQPTKYLNFDTTGTDPTPSGFVVSPSVGATNIIGISLQSANDAVERDPKSIRLEGSNDVAPTWDSGNWTVIYENAEIPDWPTTFPDGDRFQTQELFFNNTASYLHYRWTTLEVQGEGANSMQIAEVELLAFSESADCSKAEFVTHPVNTPVLDGEGAEFFTEVNGPWPLQWKKNGEAIPGAVQTVYTTEAVNAANAADVYSVEIVGCETSNEVLANLFDPATQPVSIGISFAGGGANGAPTRTDDINIGGVQLQAYWNDLPPEDDGSASGFQEDLVNSRNEATTISVEWEAGGRWGSGTGTDDTAAKFLNGLIEGGASEDEMSIITFDGVPDGTHALIAYSVARPLEFPAINFVQGETMDRIFMRQQNADEYNADPVFLQVVSTDPEARGIGNYVRFDGINPVDGKVTLNFWDGGGGNSTVNAVQLILDAPVVATPPVISSNPVSGNGITGGVAQLSVEVDDPEEATFEWRLNGTALVNGENIAGADTSFLVITNFGSANAGTYTVAITNSAGTTISAPAVLTEVSGAINDRLVGHYKFDDGAGTTAANDFGGSAAGELKDFAAGDSQWVAGQVGGALALDGENSWVLIPNYEKAATSMSVSMWVYSDAALDIDITPVIIGNWGNAPGQFRLRTVSTLDSAAFNAQIRVGPNNPNITDASGEVVEGEKWEHLAFTTNGLELTLYRNGVAVGTSAYLGDLNSGFDSLAIGVGLDDDRNPLVDSVYWEGRVDDLGVWTRPLSADEVKGIYEKGLDGIDLASSGGGLTGLRFTDVQVDSATNNVTLTWSSRAGRSYTVEKEINPVGMFDNWEELEDGLDSEGDTTTFVDEGGAGGDARDVYYRVTETE